MSKGATESGKEERTRSPGATSQGWGELLVRHPGATLAAIVTLTGFVVILAVNDWYVTWPVFFLWLGWVGVVTTARFLWGAGIALTSEREDDEGFDVEETRRDELLREKRALLKAIKEVEFDRELGKLSPEDAAQINRVYRARAIEVIKELEGTGDEKGLSVQERIAREVEARMATMPARRLKPAVAASKSSRSKKKKREKVRTEVSLRPTDAESDGGDSTKTGADTPPPETSGTGTSRQSTLGGTEERQARVAFADEMLADAEDEELGLADEDSQ